MTDQPQPGYQPRPRRYDTLDDLWADRADLPAPPTPVAGGPLIDTPARGIPQRPRPVRRRVGPVLREVLIVAVLSFGTAAAMGWTVLRSLGTVIPGEGTDAYTGLWALAWSGHALKPGSGVPLAQLFNGNAFAPADYSLALGDSLLGLGPLTWFFHGAGGLVTAYNLVFVFSPALAALGGYALARQLGAHPVGAAVAGAGFAYAPWHTGQFAHLSVLAVGPAAIALALLARGHGLTMSGLRAPRRPVWILPGWLIAAYQLTIGPGPAVPFIGLIVVIAALVLLISPVRLLRARRERRRADAYRDNPVRPRPERLRWLLPADLVGGALFAAVGLFMNYPYQRVARIDPAAVDAAHSLARVAADSPRPIDLITAPSVHGAWSWLTAGQSLSGGSNELRILPGLVLIALAGLGLLVSTWRWWWRLVLLLATAGIGVLALGTRFPDAAFPGSDPPFVLLRRYVPGWDAVVDPARLIVFATLALALLAAGAVSRMAGWGVLGHRGQAPRVRAVLFALLPIAVVLEGCASIPLAPVPAGPRALAAAAGPMVVLPSIPAEDGRVMFWTATRGFPGVANGQNEVTPSTLTRMRAAMAGFPDQPSLDYLRANGFRSVVVLKGQFGTQAWADAATRLPDPALGLTRADLGDSVLFTLPAVAG